MNGSERAVSREESQWNNEHSRQLSQALGDGGRDKPGGETCLDDVADFKQVRVAGLSVGLIG